MAVTNPINTNGVSAVPGEDNRALQLKEYTERVYAEFTTANIGMGLITTQTTDTGLAQFYISDTFSDADVNTHTPGTDATASVQKFDEVIVKVGDLQYLTSHYHELDKALSYIDAESEMARSRGAGLSQKIDKAIFTTIDSATSVAPKAGQSASSVVVNTAITGGATPEDKGDAIFDSIFDGVTALQEKNVNTMDIVFVTTVKNYNLLVRAQKAVNADYTSGANGGVDSGKIMEVAGVKILASNNLPGTADVEGYLFTPRVVAFAQPNRLVKSELNYDYNKFHWVMSDKVAYGLTVLDPTVLCVIKSL